MNTLFLRISKDAVQLGVWKKADETGQVGVPRLRRDWWTTEVGGASLDNISLLSARDRGRLSSMQPPLIGQKPEPTTNTTTAEDFQSNR